jgi:ankyrin repeat protein
MDMAIHMAAYWSSCANATALLDAKSHVDPRSLNDFTPLHLCCARDDEEASKITWVLLDRGACLEAVGGSSKQTPLLFVCHHGSPAVVELLLSRGADVKAVDRNGHNALLWASLNTLHGSEMIPLLVKAGVDVNAVTVFSSTALKFVMVANAAIMHALAEVVPPGQQLARFRPLPPQPRSHWLFPRGSPVWM